MSAVTVVGHLVALSFVSPPPTPPLPKPPETYQQNFVPDISPYLNKPNALLTVSDIVTPRPAIMVPTITLAPSVQELADQQAAAQLARQQADALVQAQAKPAQISIVKGPVDTLTAPPLKIAQRAIVRPNHRMDYARRNANLFAWGNCTQFVAQNWPVTWLGNAIEWPGNAQSQGYIVDRTPEVGAIIIMNYGAYGHAGIVVGLSGGIQIREMNYKGLNMVDSRTVPANSRTIAAFIHR